MDADRLNDGFAFGPFSLAPGGAGLFRVDNKNHVSIPVGSRALAILTYLLERSGELVSKDDIIAAVWPDTVVADANLTVQVSTLRRALDAGRADRSWIQTISGRGYRFTGSVTRIASEAGHPDPSNANVAGLPPHSEQAPVADPYRRAAASSRPLGADPPHRRVRVGRSGPLEVLDDLLQRTLSGRRQVVFVTGEAGIGKTTFVAMAIDRVLQAGAGVLTGHCTELIGANEAFLPLIDAMAELCRSPDGASSLPLLRDHAPTWLAQMPEFLTAADRAAFQSNVFGATRERMLREFCELLEILSADRPWVLVLEDLHWSDFATLDALARFARGERKAQILILATYRPTDVLMQGHPVRGLHQDLRIRGYDCAEVALERLSDADVTEYLERRFGNSELAQALAARIFARTQGQPLFVASLVEDLVAQKVIRQIDGQWRLAGHDAILDRGLPDGLRDMLTRQIERLSADEQQMLEVASVGGTEFSAAAVAGAVNRDALDIEQSLESLARRGIVLDSAGATEWPDGTYAGSYAFQHALYQETLYQRLAPGRRAQMHRVVECV